MPFKRATNCANAPHGGLYWTRTSDPIDVNDVLYQLSQGTMYAPSLEDVYYYITMAY